MGYNGKRRPEEGHPCIGHRVQSERLWLRRDQSFAVTDLVAKFPFWHGCPAITPSAQASCDSDRQTSLERSARLATQNWVRVVELEGT